MHWHRRASKFFQIRSQLRFYFLQEGTYDLSKSPSRHIRSQDACSDGQAFAAVWRMLRADDPFRDYARDSELKITIGKKLLNLVAGGVTDPLRLRNLTVQSVLCDAIETRVVPPMLRTKKSA